MKTDFLEIVRGVFPDVRDDVAILVSNPKYMGKKERARLKHYRVINGDTIYEFDAYFMVCLDDSQLLTIAKYEVDGREITHLISRVFRHR